MNYKKLIGAGVAAGGFILFSFLVWPLFGVLSDVQATIESKQATLDKSKEILAKIVDLKKRVDSKRTEIGQFTAVLPTDKKTQEVVVTIEEASRQSGIDLRDFKTAEISSLEKKTGYKILQVHLSGSGSYKSILDFFKLLEKNLRLFDIQDFTIALDVSGAAVGRLNFDLKLFTYYLGN